MTCNTPTIGACKVMKKTAMINNAATSATAACTTLRTNTTIKDESTSKAAKTKKTTVEAVIIYGSLRGDDHNRGNRNIDKRGRQQHFPAQTHHLIVTKPRHGPTQQDLQPAKKHDLDREGAHLEQHYDKWGKSHPPPQGK